MAKLVAICKVSETDIQISPLTITPASIRQKFKCRVREDVARRLEHAH